MTRLRETLVLEAEAILGAHNRVKGSYSKFLTSVMSGKPLIFSGMGKSGFIAQKAASTFRSLGAQAHYIPPADASHGDMGALCSSATVVILSHSGETPELAHLISHTQSLDAYLLAITGAATSTLAVNADEALCYGMVEEACPNKLAPTTSTTVMLALCDALAVDAAVQWGLRPEDFKALHPGGSLGARLRFVHEVMRQPPKISTNTSLMDAALAMTGEVSGIAIVVGKTGFEGVFTDGDLRRALEADVPTVAANMTRDPLYVNTSVRCDEAAALMQENRVTKILVLDALGSVVGVASLHDCK